ncbi:MAG: diguanylate phosphodiesterase [Neptuniibacter caesariensis]|uniref:Diguanylate phosphodiesterase n=1 Tax=Neptuniibacter caesariensis TaxID=207954 RepID=A0A2G6JAL4_NEPCE|nr:MAG: diguanylate phosphodiesterase [Neptuniibacter caesariensis]
MEHNGTDLLMVRQPIFDRDMKIVSYQLRYQFSELINDSLFDPETEGSMLVMQTFTSVFQDGEVRNVPVFLPFPSSMLKGGEVLLLPKKEIVVEIHADIPVTDLLVEHLKLLRKQGFRLALDGFSMQGHLIPLVKLMNIVKIDFSLMHRHRIEKLVGLLNRSGVAPLAQNVDDFETLLFCKKAGFKLFQGRFISRPTKVLGKTVPGNSAALLQLLQQLQRPNITPQEIEDLIIMDPKLSFKILRVVNSAAYQLSRPIDSMQQAVVYLGHNQLKKWATLITLAGNSDKPEAIAMNLLIRGRMCELLAESLDSALQDSAFMVGMVSQLDILLDVEMNEILRQVPLDDAIKSAISEQAGVLGKLLHDVVALEEANWSEIEKSSFDKAFLEVAYRHSLQWAEHAMQALAESD